MNLDKDPRKNKDFQLGGERQSGSLFEFLEQAIKNTDDIHKNLGKEYDNSSYEKLERRFIDLRKDLKEKLRDITDPAQELLSRTKLGTDFTEDAIRNATRAAESFQEARENSRLNRPRSTDAIEDVLISLKNLKNILDRKSKK